MAKDKFFSIPFHGALVKKAYEENHVDEYLGLLNRAMSFFIPPHDFMLHKQAHRKAFREFQEKDTFEAFWKDDILVGLYWLEGNEVDTLAIDSAVQRQGYGSMILSCALQKIFEITAVDYAVLYCVGWNHQAQKFYQKFGMERHSSHHVTYQPEDECG